MEIDRPAALADRLRSLEPMAAADLGSIRVVHAPGRVNLIGEHTDYNAGFVLPAAIDLGITMALVPTADRRVELSLAAGGDRDGVDRDGFDLDAFGPRQGRWIDYVAAVAWSLRESDVPTRGFRGVLASDLPIGAGLSSSAALEVAAAWALCGGEQPPIPPMDLARSAQRAENAYIGVASGLMDQFAVTHGVADHALLFDCRSFEHRTVPLPPGTSLVICHSGAPRALAGSAYNERRAECDRAVAALQAVDPAITTLRDVTSAMLADSGHRLDPVARRRATHVVLENERVLRTVEALGTGDLEAVGAAFQASHASLRDDFAVSSPALDALVDIADSVPGVIGARLTGAGFGGCTVNLVRAEAVDGLRQAVMDEYPGRTDLRPQVFVVRAADGARRVA